MKQSLGLILLLIFASSAWGQSSRSVKLWVFDAQKKPASDIKIFDQELDLLGITDKTGLLIIRSDKSPLYVFGYPNSLIEVSEERLFGKFIAPFTTIDTVILGSGMDILPSVYISRNQEKLLFAEEIKVPKLKLTPSIGSGIESLIQTLGGVSSGNEMSSQYNVRGGNFDENQVYVNDIEIYRPQLIQNGQQEGLSFINTDLVQTVKFSAGGFDAEYGDKMSSVLDVTYLNPDSFSSQITLGTMLNSLSLHGKRKRFSGILSFRYYTNSLLANSLNTTGNYSMSFTDVQTFINYKISKHWNVNFLGNLAGNAFQLLPQSRQTSFGTIQEAYQLDVNMAGQENLNYRYLLGALTLQYETFWKSFKWIVSNTNIVEKEYFDVEGAYFLNQLDRDMGSKTYGKPLKTLGFGYYLDHGRNQLSSNVLNFSHLGKVKFRSGSSFKYGLRANLELIYDRYLEWLYNDSADYNIAPFGYSRDSVVLDDYVRARNTLNSIRGNGFIQWSKLLSKVNGIAVNFGLRANYWSVNHDFNLMPRFSISWEPNAYYNQQLNRLGNRNLYDSLKKNNITYKFAIGAYNQPPFYRELRDFQGHLNLNVVSQKSWQAVLGMNRMVKLWNRPFKYTAEAYYKLMNDLVPYLYDNMRIRYFGNNDAHGYAWGVDNRLYGEFANGLESWVTLSILDTKEKITYQNANGDLVESPWLRRPTDKNVNFAIVFQDKLPQDPTIRVNLRLGVGTDIPYFLDGLARYTTTPNTIPPYRRVDLGFSKTLINAKTGKSIWKFKEAWVSLDIFNLLDINNVITYSWVKDLYNNRYGVPEYLTGRRINLRMYVSF